MNITKDVNLAEIVRDEVRAVIHKVLLFEAANNKQAAPAVAKAENGSSVSVSTGDYLLPVKVVKPDGTVSHRHRRRTRIEMREAVLRALPQAMAKHPTWSKRRLLRLARSVTRRNRDTN